MFPMPGSNPQTAKQSAKNRGLDPRQLGMGSAQSRQDSYATATPYGQQQQAPQQGGQGARPPAFQQFWGNLGGGYSQAPNFAQRDAFISQINSQLGRMQQQSWNQPMGAPQFNFPQMWQQAGQMVQQGWQNPFARQ
jgi:hypothetical protein